MTAKLPPTSLEMLDWGWEDYQPHVQALLDFPLNADTLTDFMDAWGAFERIAEEALSRIYVDTTLDTRDERAKQRFLNAIQNVQPPLMEANNALRKKLVESGLTPQNYDVPLRVMRKEIEMFRVENLPLITKLQELGNTYDEIISTQSVDWEGESKTLAQMHVLQHDTDRATRERAFRAVHARRLQDRDRLNALWVEMFRTRQQVAKNAGYPNYYAYRWDELGRFDYTPQDVTQFHEAIAQVIVPAVERLNAKRKAALGVETLKQWDVYVDAHGREPLKPFTTGAELEEGSARIFHAVSPELGKLFDIMRHENYLDLENRVGKAPGGYQMTYPHVERPFIFMNAVGLHDDVQTMLHEGGHAFHAFLSMGYRYPLQQHAPIEFCEVASMSMELLAQPYLTRERGGFYTPQEAARASIEHLENMLIFWAYMAVVDSFQQWAYTHGTDAEDPANCDAAWTELWHRFKRGVDYRGIEDWVATGWHRKLHIFTVPLYYIEYGIAQLGAAQVWVNAQRDQARALEQYLEALALGNTVTLPQLFSTAGAKLAFDVDTLGRMTEAIETAIAQLEQV